MFSVISIGGGPQIYEEGKNKLLFRFSLSVTDAQSTGGISFALGHYAQALSPSAKAFGTATKASGFNSLAMMCVNWA